jgi:L-lactate dehydrogenase complex protein LldG
MPQSDNPARAAILSRIRTALATPAKLHDSPGHVHAGPAEVWAPIPDPLERFAAECVINKSELIVTSGFEESVAAAQALLADLGATEVFVQDAPELRRAAAQLGAGRGVVWSSAGGPVEATTVTITLAELLVAQTGSVLISSACGGRGATVAAPIHIVFASTRQLVPDLETAMARAYEPASQNSYLCLITGSSRTADIEKILVMGAHGPKRLIILLSRD